MNEASVKSLPRIFGDIDSLTRIYLDPELRKRDNRFIVKLNEGRVYYFKENYRSAAMTLLELVETYEREDRNTPVYKDALFYLADSLYHIGNYRTATKFFQEVLTLNEPKMRPCALGRLLESSLRTSTLEEGMRYYNEALTYAQRKVDDTLLYLLGKYSYQLGRYEEAESLWEKVSEKASTYPQAQYYIGVAHVQRGALQRALTMFQRVKSLDLDALRISLNLKADEGITPEVDVSTGAVLQNMEGQSTQSVTTGCTFRSEIERQQEAQGWSLVKAHAELAIGRVHYELGQYEESFASYTDIDRKSPLFLDAIKESVWVSIRQGEYLNAYQQMQVQLIDEPNMLYDPFSRLLQGRLLSILGRFNDAQSIFGELRERFDLFKARALTPILTKAKGQLAQYFQKKLQRGSSVLDLSSLLPKVALQFTKDELSTSTSKSLFVELSALAQDIKSSKATIKDLYWVLDAPNQSEMFPKLHTGLLTSLSLRYQLFNAQAALNHQLSSKLSGDAEYKKIRQAREIAEKSLEDVPKSAAKLEEREDQVERELNRLDLRLFRLSLILKNSRAQLIGTQLYLEDDRADAPGVSLNLQKTSNALSMTKSQLDDYRKQKKRLKELSEQIKRVFLRVGLFDEVYIKEEDLRRAYAKALQQESEWLAGRGLLPITQLNELIRGHQMIDDFQNRSMRLVSENISILRQQVVQEEAKIKRYEAQLTSLTQQANRIAGQMVAKIFYQVINKLDELILEADAGFLDMLWARKNESSRVLQSERNSRRIHFEVLNRDQVK